MAVTVTIKEYNTSTGSYSSLPGGNALEFCTANVNNANGSYPLVIPPTGTYYSYWKVLALHKESTSGTVDNFKVYSDGSSSLGTGLTAYVGTSGYFSVPTGIQGLTGDDCSIASNSFFGYTSASPLSVVGSMSGATTGRVTDFIYFQLDVASTATASSVPSEGYYFRYDET